MDSGDVRGSGPPLLDCSRQQQEGRHGEWKIRTSGTRSDWLKAFSCTGVGNVLAHHSTMIPKNTNMPLYQPDEKF